MAQAGVRGLRGATTAAANTPEAIGAATRELVQALLAENGIDPADIASIIFTVTADLNAQFPALAARELGLQQVPLLCAREIDVPGSQPRCIRVLMHVNTTRTQAEMRHVYLGEAKALRPDLPGNGPAGSPPSGKAGAGAGNGAGPVSQESSGDALLEPRPRRAVSAIEPYEPGKPIDAVRRELGLTDVVKLASNENPLGPSPRAAAAVREAAAQLHLYPDDASVHLRKALGRRLSLPVEQLIVANGSDGIIKLIAETYLEPGDEIVCAEPTFSQYAYAARLMGAREVTVPLRDMRHDLEAMADRIGPRTKAVFVCNPNNPTGTTVTRADFAAFMRRVPRHVLVVLDEAYQEYVDDPDTVAGREWVDDPDHRVLVLRTFSKIYGLAALRVGYAMGPAGVIKELRRVQAPFLVNALAQAAAVAALEDEEHVDNSRAANAAGKRYFYRRLEEMGLRYVPTQANFVLIDVERDSRQVFGKLLEHGVIVRAGAAFGLPTHLRVTIGTQAQNEWFFAALEAVLAQVAAGVQAAGKEDLHR